jgi:hypothetical protein
MISTVSEINICKTIIFFLAIIYPVIGWYDFKKIKACKWNKYQLYQRSLLGTLIPAVAILLLLPFSKMTLADIGLKWITLKENNLNNWIIYPVLIIAIAYFLLNIYTIIVLNISKEARIKSSEQLPIVYKHLLPVTRKERRFWDLVSLNAGITEELLYRGYLFYALALLFPDYSRLFVLIVSTAIFGIGHIYQGLEVIKSTILGLFYGFLYIVFDSIVPLMIIHFIQDLTVRDLLKDEITPSEKMVSESLPCLH